MLKQHIHSFTQGDIRPFTEGLLVALFNTIERGSTPEEIAKNDHLMKCMCYDWLLRPRTVCTNKAYLQA